MEESCVRVCVCMCGSVYISSLGIDRPNWLINDSKSIGADKSTKWPSVQALFASYLYVECFWPYCCNWRP